MTAKETNDYRTDSRSTGKGAGENGMNIFKKIRRAFSGRRPAPCSPWRHTSTPPENTEWVIVSADTKVRCLAWNAEARQWEDWDNTGEIPLGGVEWWMPIPPSPDMANDQVERTQKASKGETDEQ